MGLTLRDVGWLVIFVIAVAAGFFLIRALIHLSGALKSFKKLVAGNQESIDKVIKDLPALSENAVNITEIAADIADNLRNEQEIIESAIESVSETIESVSDTARTINEDFLGGIKRLVKTLTTVVKVIGGKKAAAAEAAGAPAAPVGAVAGDGGGPQVVFNERADAADETPVPPDGGARERKKPARVKKRGISPARKRYADRAKNINIHIR